MHLLGALATIAACIAISSAQSTTGIEALVRRRMPSHAKSFVFSLEDVEAVPVNITHPRNDQYTVSNGDDGTIAISGTSPIAIVSGLRWYLTNYAHVDIYWFIGSRLHLAPQQLPQVNSTYHGASIVPWRYHFNTVTFSYTTAWWTFEDWEMQLDWMALHGINLPLAWVGYEKILVDVLLEFSFTESDIASFLPGPAFQAWSRFGNIQGSWGGHTLPSSWIDGQFELQKKIIARMVELGMTPVLPCFTGFVPRQIEDRHPNASFVIGSQWFDAPQYTNDTFLQPFDPLYVEMQRSFISKQSEAYGNVSHIYTLDQYNENDPSSGDLDYLRDVTNSTINALKAADPQAVWMIQGWLFYSNTDFWTEARVEAYLGGVADSDMIILDLFSESEPQWQRLDSYFGKPWIWCQLHDFGGNMGMYGQVENVTINAIEAFSNKTNTMIGMGLTMEGQEGNQVIYDILLDQAWSPQPIESDLYFHDWARARYHGAASTPEELYEAWDILRQTAYNNTNLTSALAVTKTFLEVDPAVIPDLELTGHHPFTINTAPTDMRAAWTMMYTAAAKEPTLWDHPSYIFDLTDITQQILSDEFMILYHTFRSAANKTLDSYDLSQARETSCRMLALLGDLDEVLIASGQAHFNLAPWIASARAWAAPTSTNASTVVSSASGSSTGDMADFYEYSARNQITLWGPTGQINDYASKHWGGLVRSYYIPRWEMYIEFILNGTASDDARFESYEDAVMKFELAWQTERWGENEDESFMLSDGSGLPVVVADVVQRWPSLYMSAS